MVCKCERAEEYWNATGTKSRGHFRRKDTFNQLIIAAIPVVGQLYLLLVIIFTYFEARSINRVPKRYRFKPNNAKEGVDEQ